MARYEVRLFVDVPDTVGPPTEWKWDNLVNPDGTTVDNRTPVEFVMAYPVQEGNA